MTIPIALRRNLQQRRLTLGHRDPRNPRCGFELINGEANFRLRGSLTVTRRLVPSGTAVVAGLDPAIHLVRKTLCEEGWMSGSSPGMTRGFLRRESSHPMKNAKKPNTAVDNVMTPA
jgi:hypothetical protein